MDVGPATLLRGQAGKKMNEMNNIYVSFSPVFKSAHLASEEVP